KGDVATMTTGVWITGSVKAEKSQSGLWGVAPIPSLGIPGAGGGDATAGGTGGAGGGSAKA
ncbi:MAG TPA: hypothetical protein PL072_01030, partial [Phycisphaerales bacterium]|nr:hypothetical protein [Phycisphaerales bacterium]